MPRLRMNTALKSIGIILLVSGCVAVVAKQNIRVIPLSVALEKFNSHQSGFVQWKATGKIVDPASGRAEDDE